MRATSVQPDSAMLLGVVGGNGLEPTHHRIQQSELTATIRTIGYKLTDKHEEPLPNGKKLLQMDFVRK